MAAWMAATMPAAKTVKSSFLGLRTAIYHVTDLAKAKDWYAKVLGLAPYFDQPFYVGFSVGGFELGLDPDMKGVKNGTNQVTYWGVADAAKAYTAMVAAGAKPHKAVTEVGEGIKVASVVDPFGNVFGIIENPNFNA